MNIDSVSGVRFSMMINKQGKAQGSVAFVGQKIEKPVTESQDMVISSTQGNAISLDLENLLEGKQCSYYQGPIIHERITSKDEGIYFSNSKGEVVEKISFDNQEAYKHLLNKLAEGKLYIMT